MCKPVQVYTACQFVTPIICGQNYSQVGNKKLIHLHLNWVEVSNLTSAQLEQKLIRTCSQLGHKLYVGRKLANRAKLQHFAHFRIFSFASICKMTCQGKLPDTLWTSISLMAARSSWTLFGSVKIYAQNCLQAPAEWSQPAIEASSKAASKCFMFMYFLLPQWVPATWRSLAQTSIRAELPVPSRFMRKIVCRLRLSEVSRQ